MERRFKSYHARQQRELGEAALTDRARAEVVKIIDQHAVTDQRWFDYEMDIAKLLDFPMMTDMRALLTIEFHKAKRRADLLRPERPEDLIGNKAGVKEYRAAVHEYVSAFEVAEAEAVRRRRSDFSEDEQQRMARAQNLLKLAWDEGATSDERRTAYEKAGRELAGLFVLPARARAEIEQRIAAALPAGKS